MTSKTSRVLRLEDNNPGNNTETNLCCVTSMLLSNIFFDFNSFENKSESVIYFRKEKKTEKEKYCATFNIKVHVLRLNIILDYFILSIKRGYLDTKFITELKYYMLV